MYEANRQNFPTHCCKLTFTIPKIVVSKLVITAVSCSCFYPTTVRVAWSALVVGLRIELFCLRFHFFRNLTLNIFLAQWPNFVTFCLVHSSCCSSLLQSFTKHIGRSTLKVSWDDARFMVSGDKTSLAINNVTKVDGEG